MHGLGDKSIGRNGFSFDEVQSLERAAGHDLSDEYRLGDVMERGEVPGPLAVEARRPWWNIWPASRYDAHPPLYFFVLRAWQGLFGIGEIACRSLSVLWSLVAIAALWVVVRAQSGPGPAGIAALLMACAAPQIGLAQEARGYTMATALGLLAALALMRVERAGSSPSRLAGLFTALLGMMFTHYFSMPIIAALGWYAVRHGSRDARRAMAGCGLAAAGVFAMAWLPLVLGQGANLQPAVAAWNASHEGSTVQRLLQLPANFLMGATVDRIDIWAPAARLLLGASLLLLYRLFRFVKDRGQAFWWPWLVMHLGALSLLDIATPSYPALRWIRFSLPATPAFYALLAMGIWTLPIRQVLRWAVAAAFAGSAIAMLADPPTMYTETVKPRWREVGWEINRLAGPEDVIVFESMLGPDEPTRYLKRFYTGVAYYFSPSRPALLVPPQGELSREVRERLRRSPRVWLVTPRLSAHVQAYLRGFRVVGCRSFGLESALCQVVPR